MLKKADFSYVILTMILLCVLAPAYGQFNTEWTINDQTGYSASIAISDIESKTYVGGIEDQKWFLRKYDLYGNIIWDLSDQSSNESSILGVVIGQDGRIYVTGYFFNETTFPRNVSGAINTSITSSGKADAFVACYNANGTLKWARNIGRSDQDMGMSITASEDALYIGLASVYDGSASIWGNSFAAATGKSNYYIYQMDYASNYMDAIMINSSNDVLPIHTDEEVTKIFKNGKIDLFFYENHIFATGLFLNDISVVLNDGTIETSSELLTVTPSTEAVFAMRFDAELDHSWTNSVENLFTNAKFQGASITADCSGVYLAGGLETKISFSTINYLQFDANSYSTPFYVTQHAPFITKLEINDGSFIWNHHLSCGSPDSSYVENGAYRDLVCDNEGLVWLVGDAASGPIGYSINDNNDSTSHSSTFMSIPGNKISYFYNALDIETGHVFYSERNDDAGNQIGLAIGHAKIDGVNHLALGGGVELTGTTSLANKRLITYNNTDVNITDTTCCNGTETIGISSSTHPTNEFCNNDIINLVSDQSMTLWIVETVDGDSTRIGNGASISFSPQSVEFEIIGLSRNSCNELISDTLHFIRNNELPIYNCPDVTMELDNNCNVNSSLYPVPVLDSEICKYTTSIDYTYPINPVVGTYNVDFNIFGELEPMETMQYTTVGDDLTFPFRDALNSTNDVINLSGSSIVAGGMFLGSQNITIDPTTVCGGVECQPSSFSDMVNFTVDLGSSNTVYTDAAHNPIIASEDFDNIQVEGGENLQINGDLKIRVNDQFIIKSGGIIEINGNVFIDADDFTMQAGSNLLISGSLILKTANNVIFRDGSLFNENGNQALIFSGNDLSIENGCDLKGLFYARNEINIQTLNSISGSLCGNSIIGLDNNNYNYSSNGKEIFHKYFTYSNSSTPVIHPLSSSVQDTIYYSENRSTVVVDYLGTDDYDSEGSGLTFTIIGGDDDMHFQIDEDTGELFFNVSPDYENPIDNNGIDPDNIYEIIIRLEDNLGNVTELPVHVFVTNIDNVDLGCTSTITVEDNIDPVISCIDITMDLDASGNAYLLPNQLLSSSDEICATISLSADKISFGCSDLGPNTVVLTATDPSSNTGSCTSTVTVVDNVPPILTCNTINVNLNSTGTAHVNQSSLYSSSDNCAIMPSSTTILDYSCSDIGTNTVIISVSDGANDSNCQATVNISDSENPNANCLDITIPLNASNEASIFSFDINDGSDDNCSIATWAVNPTLFDETNLGDNTVTLTVTDPSGNSSSCDAFVTVTDDTPPIAICEDQTFYLDQSGDVTISGADIDNGSSDNIGIASMTVTPSTFNCSSVSGTTDVTLTLEDNEDNISSCVAVVTIQDTIAPLLICQNSSVNLDGSGNGDIVVSDLVDSSSDNCGIASVVATSSTISTLGGNDVTILATDINGNLSSCIAILTGMDNEPPTAICQDYTVSLDAFGMASILPSDIDNGSTDNLGILTSVLSLDIEDFDCSNVGANPVILTVSDQSSNVSTCNAIVTIQDNILPTAACQDITITLDGSGNASITAVDIDNGCSDACGIASLVASQTEFTTADLGTNNITLTVTDNNTNSSSCLSTITVLDGQPPNAECKDITVALNSSGNISITPAMIDNGSTDNVMITDFSLDITSFSCSHVGMNTVELSVTDDAGNVSSCSSTVTVEDDINPVITCLDITVQIDASGIGSLTPNQLQNTLVENCPSIILSVDQDTFDCSNIGTNTVTLTATDASSNYGDCISTVTVQDTISPVLTCMPDIMLFPDAGSCEASSFIIGDPSIIEGCPIGAISNNAPISYSIGTTEVIWSFSDISGNTGTCSQMVIVEDNVAPSITCPDNITLYTDDGVCSATNPGLINATATDCFIGVIDITNNADATFGIGDNNILWQAIDDEGNTSSCIQTITVLDSISPSIICPANVEASTDIGMCSATSVFLGNPPAVDNCTVQSVTSDELAEYQIGATTVTWTVTDNSSNESSCTQTVTVIDNEAPVVICSNVNITLDDNGLAQINESDIVSSNTDNCHSDPSLTFSRSLNFDCAEDMIHIVDVTSSDGINTSECTANVTVQLYQAPTINDQEFCSSDNATIEDLLPTDGTIVWFDTLDNLLPSGELLVTGSYVGKQITGSCYSYGSTINVTVITNPAEPNYPSTVDFCATDSPTLADILALQTGTPNDSLLVYNAATGGVEYTNLTELVSDNETYWIAQTIGNCESIRTGVTVHFTSSTTLPNAICISDTIIVNLDNAGDGMISVADVDNGSNMPGSCYTLTSISIDQTSFDCSNIGINTMTLTVTGSNGQIATCQSFVEVKDTISPMLTCQDFAITLDNNGEATLLISDVLLTNSDACGIQDESLSQSDFTCSDSSPVPVVLTSIDNNGNVSECTSSVAVNLIPAPSINDQDFCSGDIPTAGDLVPSIITHNWYNSLNQQLTVTDNLISGTYSSALITGSCESDRATVTITVHATPDTPNFPSEATYCAEVNSTITTLLGETIDIPNDIFVVYDAEFDGNQYTSSDLLIDGNTYWIGQVANVCESLRTGITVDISSTTTQPEAVCTSDTIVVNLDNMGIGSISYMDVNTGSNMPGGCYGITMTLSDSIYDCSNLGNQLVTLNVTGSNAMTNTCTSTVLVQDITPPALNCVSGVIGINLDDDGNALINPMMLVSNQNDNCSILSTVASPSSLGCDAIYPLVGDLPVQITTTDFSGNINTCTAMIQVLDTIAPLAECQNIEILLDADGNASVTASQIGYESVDNCVSGLSMELSQYEFTAVDFEYVTDTLTVTDISGNSSSCISIITIGDEIPPNAVCTDTTIYLNEIGMASVTAAELASASTDNGVISSYVATQTLFDCDLIGDQSIEVTVTDIYDNASTCASLITVLDTISPTITTQNIDVYLDQNGEGVITLEDAITDSNDNCGNPSLSISQENFDCDDLGINIINANANDGSNFIEESTIVTVIDTIKPQITCENIDVNLNAIGLAMITAEGLVASGSVTDNCEVVSLISSQSTFTCADLGSSNQVTVTAMDPSDNERSCIANVTVHDLIAPIINNCIGDQIFNNMEDSCGAYVQYTEITASDNCLNPTITPIYTIDHVGVGTWFDVGEYTQEYTVSDLSGNETSCQFNIIVQDTQAPTITCNTDTTLNTELDECGAYYDFIDPITGDNCGISSFVRDEDFATGDLFPTGTTTFAYEVEDLSGNQSTCSYTITVVDEVIPVVTCPGDTMVVGLDQIGEKSLSDIEFDESIYTRTDNCGIASFQTSIDGTTEQEFYCSNVGTVYTVDLIATDNVGNMGQCAALIVIEDITSPVAECGSPTYTYQNGFPYDLTLDAFDNGSYDNCGIDTMYASQLTFEESDIGNDVPVTLTVVDAAGNESTCISNVTVIGGPSDITCADGTAYLNEEGVVTLDSLFINDLITVTTLGIPENDYTLNPIIQEYNCSNIGDNELEITITNTSLFTSSCTSTITVLDNIAPVITCPEDTLVQLDACQFSIADHLEDLIVSDNCSNNIDLDLTQSEVGVTTWDNDLLTNEFEIILTASDVYDNESTCSFNYIIALTDVPSIECGSDTTFYVDESSCEVIVNINDLNEPIVGSCVNTTTNTEFTTDQVTFSIGNNEITWFVTDIFDQTNECTQNIEVIDNIAPVIECPEGGQQCVVPTMDNIEDAVAQDNCTNGLIPEYTIDPNENMYFISAMVTDASGNEATCDYFIEKIDTVSTPDAGEDQVLNNVFEGILIGNDPEIGSPIWDGPTGVIINDPMFTETVVSNLSEGDNIFTYEIVENGCVSLMDSVIISVTEFLMPTGFSPNGDGVNDLLVIRGINAYPKSELLIFDRNGSKIFSQVGYQNDWDGTSEMGALLPRDTYFYILEIPGGKSRKGSIEIKY